MKIGDILYFLHSEEEIDIEFVKKPSDNELSVIIYELLLKNGCMKTADIKKELEKRDILAGEHKVRAILKKLVGEGKAFYRHKRGFCISQLLGFQ